MVRNRISDENQRALRLSIGEYERKCRYLAMDRKNQAGIKVI
ncbi:MAG: Unknown protein [uncultured Aureispira sp.]|uniref:Uncharacterized protein n=1 Tax=uncultured Aureispira sp. TaxID=1331704 RepID=A0A6S6S9R5_9BACT|nr:MAG: Unknown protein [uncultured Aureispira sp.]